MTLHGVQYVDIEQVKSYCSDLRSLLADTDIVKSKAFLRSFVEKIVVDGGKCTIHYKLPVPATWQGSDDLVLPIEPSSGAEGIRTPYLLVANEALSLLSYSPKMVNYLSSFSGTRIPYSLSSAGDKLPDTNEALPDEIGTTAPRLLTSFIIAYSRLFP